MKAYELLSDESKWCQGDFARDVHGEAVNSHSPEAVRWCLTGALSRCYMGYSDQRARIVAVIGGGHTTTWNDNPLRTYAEVVGLLKRLDI